MVTNDLGWLDWGEKEWHGRHETFCGFERKYLQIFHIIQCVGTANPMVRIAESNFAIEDSAVYK